MGERMSRCWHEGHLRNTYTTAFTHWGKNSLVLETRSWKEVAEGSAAARDAVRRMGDGSNRSS